MKHELRCEGKLHGRVIDDHTIEVSCDSRFCGKKPGVVVLHRFDLRTEAIIKTERYKTPPVQQQEGNPE